MNRLASFAYAQARLHARHARRLGDADWRRLASVGDLLQLLQAARASALRGWVLPFTEDTDVHEMELRLCRQFREYVAEVAAWQPRDWREAVRWTMRLPDLPALRHLLSGEPAWPWIREDEALARFVAEDGEARREALRRSGYGPMVRAWEQDDDLFEGWLVHWRRLWPRAPRDLVHALERLGTKMRRHVGALAGDADRERERVVKRLEHDFRRHTHQPAAACIHIALVAVELAALRAELVRHRLFDTARTDTE